MVTVYCGLWPNGRMDHDETSYGGLITILWEIVIYICNTDKLTEFCIRKDVQQQQLFYGPLSGTTWVSRYQKKHSPTHHPDHHPIFIRFFHLPRSIASSMVQMTCLAIFMHLFPCPLWSTSWSAALHLIFHTFLYPISVFSSQHMPIPSQPALLQYQYYIIYSQSSSQLLTWNSVFYLNILHPSDHSHLCSLKCHLIFFPDRPGFTSM